VTQVETVLGPIDAMELGFTLSHEHVLISEGNDLRNYPWLFDLDRTRDNAVHELIQAKAGGVSSLIDLTTPDLGRNVVLVREISRASGINVVMATGIWCDIPRSFWAREPDAISDIFIREIEVGIEDSGVKAGVIKVANDAGGVTPEGERILRGAARASRRTGCPISTHQFASARVGQSQVEIFLDEGVPMNRICIGHSADTTDVAYLEELLQSGVYLSMDRYPGRDPYPSWKSRNRTLKELIDRGWADRLMLGHDHAAALVPVDGTVMEHRVTPFLQLSTTALPALEALGVGSDVIHTMTHDVPRRFLSGVNRSEEVQGMR
jgi:phosphotriesterase-related protein